MSLSGPHILFKSLHCIYILRTIVRKEMGKGRLHRVMVRFEIENNRNEKGEEKVASLGCKIQTQISHSSLTLFERAWLTGLCKFVSLTLVAAWTDTCRIWFSNHGLPHNFLLRWKDTDILLRNVLHHPPAFAYELPLYIQNNCGN